jgi:hypothetical protein
MSKIYAFQSNAPINIDTGISLATATATKILFKRPDGSSGEWDAVATGSTLTYDPTDTDLNQWGDWQFQAYCEIDGEAAYGEVIKQVIYQPLNK